MKWFYTKRTSGNIIFLHFLAFTTTFIVLLTNKTACAACTEDEWDCDDGQCIDRDSLCDGEINCNDGSDETAESCIALPCAQFAFRCTYGGCVAGNGKCNLRKDCADNSDEAVHLCGTNTQVMNLERELMGDCGENFFKCRQTGECIENMNRCDGHRDCSDGSDETVELCSTTSCPQFAFKCGYGGCIAGNLRCDGKDDCLDFSDESAKLCDNKRRRNIGTNITSTQGSQGSVTRVVPTPPTWTGPTETPSTPPTTTNGCGLERDANMIVVDFFQRPLLGSIVAANAIVNFKCRKGFTLLGHIQNSCNINQWNYPLPKCQKFCSTKEVTRGLSTFVTCERDGSTVKCTDTVPPKTVARIGCATGFTVQRDATVRLSCEANGDWNYRRSKCKLVCGKVAPTATEFSRGGRPTSILEVPWHVGIYSNFRGEYIHQCGGTIIGPSLVISAAHCFWNEASERLFEEKYYRVVAGKYYRDYAKEQDQYQASDITKIILKLPYSNRASSYKNDIAVVLLTTPFKFTASVSPACIRFGTNSRKEVDTGAMGKFAGWGVTENHTAADELQSVTMTALSNADCRRQLKNYGNYDLPDDKFCLKDDGWGKSACRGDSGGGFVLTENNEGTIVHYLIGIISHAPAKDQDCAIDGVVALTNINYFDRLIQPYMDEETNHY